MNQLQVFMRYKKLPKSALISLVNFGTKKNSGLIKLQAQYAEPWPLQAIIVSDWSISKKNL
jgi:hypothetical protein